MSRAFPAGITGSLGVPWYSGIPSGGDLLSLYIRLWSFSTASSPRVLTTRENGGNMWALQWAAGGLDFAVGWSGGAKDFLVSGAFPASRWIDIVVTYDYTSTATSPIIYYNGAVQTASWASGSPSGTPNTTAPTSLLIGNRQSVTAPAQAAVSEIAMWRGRILSPWETRRLTEYGPSALQRGQTLALDFEAFGGLFTANTRAPYHAKLNNGTGVVNYTPAPPRRKRRWFNVPLGYMPTSVTGAGNAVGVAVATASAILLAVCTATGVGSSTATGVDRGSASASGTAAATATAVAVGDAGAAGVATAVASGDVIADADATGVANGAAASVLNGAASASGVATSAAAGVDLGSAGATGVAIAAVIPEGGRGSAGGVAVATASGRLSGAASATGLASAAASGVDISAAVATGSAGAVTVAYALGSAAASGVATASASDNAAPATARTITVTRAPQRTVSAVRAAARTITVTRAPLS